MNGFLKGHPALLGLSRNGIKVFIACILLNSCDSKESTQAEKVQSSQKSNAYLQSNFNSFKNIFQIVNDSINTYTDERLESFLTEYIYDWVVDSMICINSTQDKLVGIVVSSAGVYPEDVTDDATKFLGKKINGIWYFFKSGGSLAILRSSYGKTGKNPLSFHELSQIARKEMLEGALIKNEKGEFVVDDKWVEEHFYNAGFDTFNHHKIYGMVSPGEEYQMPRDKEKTDSVHWHLILDKWNHKIDTNEYKPREKAVLP